MKGIFILKKADFLIAYEVKRRDLEYLTLLKVELERRGYVVVLDAANRLRSYQKPIYEAEVVISGGFSYEFVNFGNSVSFRKAIELMTEQIKNSLENNYIKERDDIGKDLVVNVWGNKQKERLIELEKVPGDKVFALGSIDMDFLKPRFEKFDYSKEYIAKEYNLDPQKKWILFISSMTNVIGDDDETDELGDNHISDKLPDVYKSERRKTKIICEKKTRKYLRQWFRRVFDEFPDAVIIYRPHPVEMISDKFLEFEKEYEGFKIIRDYSVRQWIKVCEKCYNWYSTSGIQAYFINKPFYILRPVPIDRDIEVECFKNTDKYITTYEMFRETILNDASLSEYSPIDPSIYDYYAFSNQEYTYEKVADMCEEIFKNDQYIVPEKHIELLKKCIKSQWKKSSFKEKIALFGRRTIFYGLYHKLFSPNVDYMNTSNKELMALEKRIRECISTK